MLAAAVDIKRWLREDRQTPYSERLRRDREIGLSLTASARVERVLDWWAKLAPVAGEGPRAVVGARVCRLRRMAVVLLCVAGAVLGVGVAGVAFGYQGDYPVNVVALLGVVVGVPLIMLVITVVLMLPGIRATGTAVFSAANPGRWAGALLDRFVDVELFAAFDNKLVNAFSRWQLVVFSQWLALGFFLGVLGMAWLLVAFTDLAFGWSTTLRIESADVSRWFSALATPWGAWVPAAVPDAALVEASRFYRLEAGNMAASRAAYLGQWWPFVLMFIATYGLLPRLALLVFAGWRLREATRALLRDDPEVTALVDRLDTPHTSYEGHEDPVNVVDAGSAPAPSNLSMDDATRIVVWNDAANQVQVDQWLGRRFGIRSGGPCLQLSVLQAASEQQKILDGLDDRVRRLVIFTKGWEPPLLEFGDFLDLLRQRLGLKASLIVVPVDVAGDAVLGDEREVWARALARRHDPQMYVVEADGAPVAQS